MSAPLPDAPPLTGRDRRRRLRRHRRLQSGRGGQPTRPARRRRHRRHDRRRAQIRHPPHLRHAEQARPVLTGTFAAAEANPQHISLTERADLMLVAPATSNLIAKAANGICDDLVSLMIAAAACPVVFAPAMNNRMWENPIAKANREKLAKLGYKFMAPEEGWLACRNIGAGRLAAPDRIAEEVAALLTDASAVRSRV
jgi:hypothetical protein